MSNLIARALGRPPEALPDDLTSLSDRQLARALDTRESRMRTLATQSGGLTAEERAATLEELRATKDDIARLRAATPAYEEPTRPPSEETVWLKTTSGARREAEPRGAAEHAIRMVIARFVMPRELTGVRLDHTLLTEEEGEELARLLSRRMGEGGPAWDEEAQARMESLIEQAAGAPVFSELQRERDLLAFAEEVRRSTLPDRRRFLAPGEVSIPAEFFDDMRESSEALRGNTAADLATLAILLNSFALRDASLFSRAMFDGADVLVSRGPLRFASGVNPPLGALDGVSVQPDLAGLEDAGYVTTRRRTKANAIEIRLGPRATP